MSLLNFEFNYTLHMLQDQFVFHEIQIIIYEKNTEKSIIQANLFVPLFSINALI